MSERTWPLQITPETKIGKMLDIYPQLEKTLVDIAPVFSKLKNPVLRKTVARVATLRQAADVGKVPLSKLVNILRSSIGMSELDGITDLEENSSTRPDWVDESRIVKRLDAKPIIKRGEQPIGRVLKEITQLSYGQIYELTTPIIPVILIDIAIKKGFLAWHFQQDKESIITYFYRPKERKN